MAAPLPPPGSTTIVADDQLLVVPSPIIVAESKVSTCIENDMEHLWKQFDLPADITTQEMTAEECLNRPPNPLVGFNKSIMKNGARLPLHPLVRGVIMHFCLSLSKLNPNAYKIMAGIHILWRKLFELDFSVEEVCYLYKPYSKKSKVGYFFLAP